MIKSNPKPARWTPPKLENQRSSLPVVKALSPTSGFRARGSWKEPGAPSSQPFLVQTGKSDPCRGRWGRKSGAGGPGPIRQGGGAGSWRREGCPAPAPSSAASRRPRTKLAHLLLRQHRARGKQLSGWTGPPAACGALLPSQVRFQQQVTGVPALSGTEGMEGALRLMSMGERFTEGKMA